jgi:hypothetical protein
MQFWDKLARLIFLYVMFAQVFQNFDQIYKYSFLEQLQDKLNQMMLEGSMFEVSDGMFENFFIQSLIMSDLPGKTCPQLGARTAIFLRKVLRVKLDENYVSVKSENENAIKN